MDINQTNYDATFCGTIPLHNTNAIQSHAVLLIVNAVDFRVIQISANLCEWLGVPSVEVLDHPLEKLVEMKGIEDIRYKYKHSLLKNVVPIHLTFISNDIRKTYLARVHEREHYLLIEVEFINET